MYFVNSFTFLLIINKRSNYFFLISVVIVSTMIFNVSEIEICFNILFNETSIMIMRMLRTIIV